MSGEVIALAAKPVRLVNPIKDLYAMVVNEAAIFMAKQEVRS
jgi:hypothetical protein